MNRFMKFAIAITMGVTLIGCGAATKEIMRMSRSERTDVFTEVSAEGAAPAGLVDLVIKASIKTPLEGYYALESKGSVHGKPSYPFLVNIDDQAVLWKVGGVKETIPLYDEKGKVSHDPDAGVGMKYNLEKKVRLAAGPHTVFFGLPGEPYTTKVRLMLKEGGSPVLELKPHYRYKRRPTRLPTFLKGISSYEVAFTGQIVRQE
jgi:hypothetical protein